MSDPPDKKGFRIRVPTEAELEKLVIEEEKIRMSVEYQEACSKASSIPNGWLQVTADMQMNLVKRFGFDDNLSSSIACNMLRRARYLYPDNKIFKEVPVYVRENKANMGTLKEGDEIPNINIHTIDGKEIKLHDIINNDKINMFFTGSET